MAQAYRGNKECWMGRMKFDIALIVALIVLGILGAIADARHNTEIR